MSKADLNLSVFQHRQICYCLLHKSCRMNKTVALLSVNVGCRWRWVFNLTLCPLYPVERAPLPTFGVLGGAQNKPGRVWRRENLLFRPSFELLSCDSALDLNIMLGRLNEYKAKGSSCVNLLVAVWLLLFSRFSQNCEKRLLASSCPSVCVSGCPHRTTRLPLDGRILIKLDFVLFSKTCQIQVLLKSDENNGYILWRRFYIYDNMSLNSSDNEKCFRQKSDHQQRKILCERRIHLQKKV
jgi:hypothetical protein